MTIRARVLPALGPRALALEALLGLGTAGLIALVATTPNRGDRPLPLLVAAAALLVLTQFRLRRTAPLVPFAVNAALAAVTVAGGPTLLITAYAVGRYTGSWRARAAAAVAGTVALVQPWVPGTTTEVIGRFGGAAIGLLLPGALGAWARTRAQLVAALTDRAERAEAERELLARETVLTERTRIAREMHDAVGHRVSLMVLQAGAIEMAAADQQRVEQLAGHVQTAGRQALDELRQLVGVLRGDEAVGESAPLRPQPGLEDVAGLVEESRAAGLAIQLTGPPADAAPVDPAVGRAAYRIVQEALTNSGKHAPGAAVSVRLERPAGQLVVRVVNGPAVGAPSLPAGGGYGLVGLGERVRVLDGRLHTELRLDGGFSVEAVLPA
jgi:signal transduction histidine kinase